MTWTAIALFAIAGVLLALEYRTHLSTLLPWLILLACPLMHVFMHRGHGQRHRNKP